MDSGIVVFRPNKYCKGLNSTSSFVGLDPWGLDPGAWKKPKLSKSEVNLKKVEKIHEKSKPVCEQSNR